MTIWESLALRVTRQLTIAELLAENGLREFTTHTDGCYGTDEVPDPVHGGGWASCLRCELLEADAERRLRTDSPRLQSLVTIAVTAKVEIGPAHGASGED